MHTVSIRGCIPPRALNGSPGTGILSIHPKLKWQCVPGSLTGRAAHKSLGSVRKKSRFTSWNVSVWFGRSLGSLRAKSRFVSPPPEAEAILRLISVFPLRAYLNIGAWKTGKRFSRFSGKVGGKTGKPENRSISRLFRQTIRRQENRFS